MKSQGTVLVSWVNQVVSLSEDLTLVFGVDPTYGSKRQVGGPRNPFLEVKRLGVKEKVTLLPESISSSKDETSKF